MHRTWIAAGLLLIGFAFAGCIGGDDLDGRAFIDYEGEEPGSESDSVECDEDGQLTVTASVQDGGFAVEISDETGTVYEQDYNGTLDGETQGIEGEPGTWTLNVVRASGFEGSYAVQLGC